MSRIGKKEIIVPENVEVIINSNKVKVRSKKGELYYNTSKLISIKKTNNKLQLVTNSKSQKAQALHGLSRSIINNMVIGVSQGFEKKLIIQGVGYKSQMEEKNLILNMGYSHPVKIEPPEDITIKVENNTQITISGINKETVGEIAAKIRAVRPPEPYKGKGIKYSDEVINRKIGKAGK